MLQGQLAKCAPNLRMLTYVINYKISLALATVRGSYSYLSSGTNQELRPEHCVVRYIATDVFKQQLMIQYAACVCTVH